MSEQPIAVFDSGLGGLSVVRHMRQILPNEDIVYFGDTARVPYGSKSKRTVVTFALECARFLLDFDPKLVVAACNTASALAIKELRSAMPTPVVGVVEPGAAAAVKLAAGGRIAVIGTEATISSGAYPAAIRALAPEAEILTQPCPLFVPLVEEGRSADDPLVRLAIESYLAPLKAENVRVVVLGCTHYPLLREAIVDYFGPGVQIVDSGRETSLRVRQQLTEQAALSRSSESGSMRCYVSDNPARFKKVGSRFLQQDIDEVELVEPERYIGVAMPSNDA